MQPVRLKAEEFISQHNPTRSFPFDIERFLEGLGFSIVPVPRLRNLHSCDAYLGKDLEEISVDKHVYYNIPMRFRFSLAHELGHIIMHTEIFSSAEHSNMQEWASWRAGLDAQMVQNMEREATFFAGFILAPLIELREIFNETRESWSQRGREFINLDQSAEYEFYMEISKNFEVSDEVIKRRIQYEIRKSNIVLYSD